MENKVPILSDQGPNSQHETKMLCVDRLLFSALNSVYTPVLKRGAIMA